MIKKNKLIIPKHGSYPDPLAPWEVKETDDYGKKMGQLITYEWFNKANNSQSAFFSQRNDFDLKRRYARAEQNSDVIKSLITDGTKGESYTNFDWRPIQILPKFIKLVVNQMLERLYQIDAQAVDGISQGLRDKYKSVLEKSMVSKPMLEDAKKLLNIDLTPSDMGEIPETPEEIDLHMRLKYKPAIEIAIEEALKYTLELNEYDEIQKKLLKDLVEIGVSAVYHTTDPVKGILVEYRDPADMVWSYPTKSNFKNVYYYGHVKRMTLAELQRISGKKFDKDSLRSFADISSQWQTYNKISDEFWYRGDDLPNNLVDVLNFTYKTTKTTKYKKKYRKNGTYAITEKPSNFIKDDRQKEKEENQGYKDFDILEDTIDVWYEGSMVLGTDMIFNYGECSNMIRPEGYINNDVMSNYIMYAPELYQGRIQSLVDRVMQTVDQLHQIQIKIQQFIAKAKPNGIWIDVDGLQELDLGEGNTFTPLELVRYYDDTGNLIGTSKLNDGGYNNGAMPIKELNNGGIAGLEQLMNSYNFELQLFREAIGISQGADATLPDPRTSVGALQQSENKSNVSTRYILESQLKITQYLANGLSLRLNSIFKHENLRNAYINSIGRVNVDVLESLKSLHLHDFGITIKLKPDAQERAMLEQNIQAEIAAGGISTTDGIDIRKIGNLSYANEMLKIRKEKHLKKIHQRELEKITAQSEGNAKASKVNSKIKQEEIKLESDSKLKLEREKRETRRLEIEWEEAAKTRLMDREFKYKTGIDVYVADKKAEGDQKKEDNKAIRQAESATQQSKIKAESKKDNPQPIKFESANTSITGDLGLDDFRT